MISKGNQVKKFFFFGHRSLIRNNTQTAVINMTKNRMLENKLFNLTFRMFRHTSSEVTVYDTSNN